jgi:hypothetical protein
MQAIMHRPCSRCGCLKVWLAKDGQLRCTRCRYDRGKLSIATNGFIRAVEQNFGPIKEAVVLRQKEEAPPRQVGLQRGRKSECKNDPDICETRGSACDM